MAKSLHFKKIKRVKNIWMIKAIGYNFKSEFLK